MSIDKLSLKRITALFIVIFVLFASFNELIPTIIAQNEDEAVEILASGPKSKRFFGDQLGFDYRVQLKVLI